MGKILDIDTLTYYHNRLITDYLTYASNSDIDKMFGKIDVPENSNDKVNEILTWLSSYNEFRGWSTTMQQTIGYISIMSDGKFTFTQYDGRIYTGYISIETTTDNEIYYVQFEYNDGTVSEKWRAWFSTAPNVLDFWFESIDGSERLEFIYEYPVEPTPSNISDV